MQNWQHNSLYRKYNILIDLYAIQRIIFIIVQAVKVCPWHPSVWQKCCRSKLVYSVSICARGNPARCHISTPLVRCHYITPDFWGCITLRLWLFSEMFYISFVWNVLMTRSKITRLKRLLDPKMISGTRSYDFDLEILKLHLVLQNVEVFPYGVHWVQCTQCTFLPSA